MPLVLRNVAISKANYPRASQIVTPRQYQQLCHHKSIFNVLLQDIKRCIGPKGKLTELNADVKKNFHNLRIRIQVRSYISANMSKQLMKCASVYINIIYVTSFTGFRADGNGAGQRVKQADYSQSGRGTQKADAQVMSCHWEAEAFFLITASDAKKNVKCVILKFHCFCSNQTSWRKANLASKLSIDNMEKQELLDGPDGAVRQR